MPRDDFSAKTKDILAKRVAYCCSNPNCGIKTVGPNSDSKSFTNIGIAAHITAASEGGPRYNRFLTQEQRSSEMNGIWLCQNCAHLIDVDVKQYPETLLRKWKQITENNTYTEIISRKSVVTKNATLDKVQLLDIFVCPTNNCDSIILDIRVKNNNDSPVYLNTISFGTLTKISLLLFGGLKFSNSYDFDLKSIEKCGQTADLPISQLLDSGEVDRFSVILTYTQETCFCYGWELAVKIQSDIGFLPERTIEFFLEKKHDNSTVDNVRHFMKKIFFLPALKIPVITMKGILNFFIIGCGFGRYSTVLFRKRFIRRLGVKYPKNLRKV